MQDRKRRHLAVPSVLRRHGWMLAGTLLAVILIVGCAKQYHWYRCGCDCVNYQYYPPTPLPYTPYCSCPTPVSTSYHSLLQADDQSSTMPPESPPETPEAAGPEAPPSAQ